MLPIGIFLILFFGLSTATAQGKSDLMNTAHINVTGVYDGYSAVSLARLRYDCCAAEKGNLSGLCLPEPTNTLVPTIEITFDYPSEVTEVVVQAPADPQYGFVQFVYISYKTDSSEPTPTVFRYKGQRRIYTMDPKSPIDMSHVPKVKTLYLQIRKGDYYKKPCLRLKIEGYKQKDYPIVDKDPELTTTTNKIDNTVTFKCSITPRKGFRHFAEWVLDDQKVITNKIQQSTEELVSKIHQADLYQYLPDLGSRKKRNGLKCSVTICNDSNCASTKSKVARDSNALTPTFTVSPEKLTLAEGEFGKIVIKLDGPPFLFLDKHYAEAYGTKYIRLEAQFSSNSGQKTCSKVAVVVQSTNPTNKECGPLVTDWTTPQTITIKAVTDGLYIKSRNISSGVYLIHFAERAGRMTPISQKVFKHEVIEVTNSDKPGHCKAYGEAHITTFDGLHFMGHSEGEFIAYKRGDYQVNSFFVNCGEAFGLGTRTWASCNCGVAIKAADEVVVLTLCPKGSSTMSYRNVKGLRTYTFINGNPSAQSKFRTGMRVYSKNHGCEYFVTLPTGTYIKVKMLLNYVLDFIVIPTVSDWEISTGYCGHFDGNRNNDQRNRDGSVYRGDRNRFVEVWRENSCSLFHGVMKHTPNNTESYCRCTMPNFNSYKCGKDFGEDPCPPTAVNTAVEVTEQIIKNFAYSPGPNACRPPRSSAVGKRSVNNPMRHLRRRKRSSISEPTWPTKSGWTEAKARSYCEDYILKKDAVKNCKTYLGTTFSNEINSCIFDIKASDSTVFSQSTLGAIIASCLAEVEKEPPNVEGLNGGVQKTVLLSLLSTDNCNGTGMCKGGNCSGKGICKGGQCVCNDGYYGSVCSLTKQTPPKISYIPHDGLCNMRSRNCSRSEVFGKDIIESPDLKCRLTPYDPVKKVRDDSGQFTTTARFVSFNKVFCPHDGNFGNFLIALSNNGKDYSSDELLFMAYDSACFNCTIDQDEKEGNCTRLKTGCFIGSKCYLPEELDANSNDTICDPDRNINNTSLSTVKPHPLLTTANEPITPGFGIIDSTTLLNKPQYFAPNTTLTYVKRQGTRMTAKWVPLRHSFTKLQIKYCRHDNLAICRYHVVMNPRAAETSFVIEGSAMVKSVLVLFLEVFDGPDLVFRSTPVTESKEGGRSRSITENGDTNVGMITGITVTFILVIVAVIVTFFILHRRNTACLSGSKMQQNGPVQSNSAANEMGTEPTYVNINPAFEAGENAGASPGENEPQDLHLRNKHHEYMNVTTIVRGSKMQQNGPAQSYSAANETGTEPTYVNMNPAFEAGENAGASPAKNEPQDLHLGNKHDEYMNVTTTVEDDYAEPDEIEENPYAELNITPDVIAEQTYSELRRKED